MASIRIRAVLQLARLRTLYAYRHGDWRKLPIAENHEPMVQVPLEQCYPYYARQMKLVADERIFLRAEVLRRFQVARAFLKDRGFDLIVYDGWRSLKLQERLFWFYMREFTAAKFNLKEQFAPLEVDAVREYFAALSKTMQSNLKEANRSYVSWPSKDPSAPSPHATGVAIDVWLYQNGQPVNLGVPFDWMEVDAGAFYHFRRNRKPFLGNDRIICARREIMLYAMIQAGFTCYGPEIWHFNYGNQMDALVRGGHAVYSYIEPSP